MTVHFAYTELTDFFRELRTPIRLQKHLLKTIETTRKVGIEKLEALIAQEAIKKELFDKIKMAVENPQFKIEIK